MGKGKGQPEYWVAVVKPGHVLFELSGVSEEVAKEALSVLHLTNYQLNLSSLRRKFGINYESWRIKKIIWCWSFS